MVQFKCQQDVSFHHISERVQRKTKGNRAWKLNLKKKDLNRTVLLTVWYIDFFCQIYDLVDKYIYIDDDRDNVTNTCLIFVYLQFKKFQEVMNLSLVQLASLREKGPLTPRLVSALAAFLRLRAEFLVLPSTLRQGKWLFRRRSCHIREANYSCIYIYIYIYRQSIGIDDDCVRDHLKRNF